MYYCYELVGLATELLK